VAAEGDRLAQADRGEVAWRRWGPYLAERQWGTVREDVSNSGASWESFPHDHARSRAYLRGEDGLAGISDDRQLLCFAVALWNGVDPILKERLFGLTNTEGNHGEDVKEQYYYLDATPTHSYMRYLYKYPQRPFPYADLVATNRQRGSSQPEYELIDAGVFDDDRYFDVEVEYAKATPDDLVIVVSAYNRGPEPATLHVLPTLWYRNRWTRRPSPLPSLRALERGGKASALMGSHHRLGERYFYADGAPPLLFTNNETNSERLWGTANAHAFVKDGINDFVVHGATGAVNPEHTGTKAAAHYVLTIAPGGCAQVRMRLSDRPLDAPFADAAEVMTARAAEADEFYAAIAAPGLNAEERRVFRQAMAGMLWTKQYYTFDVSSWLQEHGAHPLTSKGDSGARNRDWFHMVNADVISMPDKWEYPWYAAWDLAFHAVALAPVDLAFAKQQMMLVLGERYLHPNGQIPAYEWNFSDVNPPVHAWATLFLYNMEKAATGKGDVAFLAGAFQKLLMNFTWWVNRTDPRGSNVFAGGFLGLDNIGVFDRSAPLPTSGFLEQADGTAWMALYCLNMLEIAAELAAHDPVREEMVVKFVEHFLWIAAAMNRIGDGHEAMWDEHDGFFYDVLRLPDGRAQRLGVRSIVGLVPLCAATVIEAETIRRFPQLVERVERFVGLYPDIARAVHPLDRVGVAERRLLAVLNETNLRRVLARLFDEDEFLSPHGVRSLSRYHREHPFVFYVGDNQYRVDYQPADSTTATFGGNSNWRGPVWAPINALVIRTLMQLYAYYGDDFVIDYPTGSGRKHTLYEAAADIAARLAGLFLPDDDGRRPVFGGADKLQRDPHFRDHILFYEYFHGDNGAGIGASHQTGWTGLVGLLLDLFAKLDADTVLRGGRLAMVATAASKGS